MRGGNVPSGYWQSEGAGPLLDRDGHKTIVEKSTVPVGTSSHIRSRMEAYGLPAQPFNIAANPEFLREGAAVEDFFHPNRIVIGTRSDRAAAIMKDLYRPLYLIQTPFVMTTGECAELIKYAANSYLAVKISFINEIANLWYAIGGDVDVHTVARALGDVARDGHRTRRQVGGKTLQPGDLLVASPHAGYAMRADSLSSGTIVGKALGELQSGTGTIAVMVTLQ